MYERNDHLGMNPYWTNMYRYLPIKVLDPKMFILNNFDIEIGKAAPEPPAYRFLEVSEIIKEGDEYLLSQDDVWKRVMACIDTAVVPQDKDQLRRKVRLQDAAHRWLDVGETIREGDELHSVDRSWYPSTNIGCPNPNQTYRRRKWPEEAKINKSIQDTGTKPSAVETLKDEVETLKDQLANTLAELNEVKAKKEVGSDYDYYYLTENDTVVPGDEVWGKGWRQGWRQAKLSSPGKMNKYVVGLYRRKISKQPVSHAIAQYRLLEKTDIIQKALGDEFFDREAQKWVPTPFTRCVMDESSVGRFRRPLNHPVYRYLKEGDVLQPEDECFDVNFGVWRNTCCTGKIIGSVGTTSNKTGLLLDYRRKVS